MDESDAEVLAEFRAGLLLPQDGMLRPDTRKGKVQVVLTSDSLVHFQWVDRTSGEVVEDVIVFPTEAKLVALPQPRCYTLKFGQADRHLFFWMQEPKAETDAELVAKVNRSMGADGEGDMDSAADSAGVPATPVPPLVSTRTRGGTVGLVTPATYNDADVVAPLAPLIPPPLVTALAGRAGHHGGQGTLPDNDLGAMLRLLAARDHPPSTPAPAPAAPAPAAAAPAAPAPAAPAAVPTSEGAPARIDARTLAGALGNALQSALSGAHQQQQQHPVAPGPSLSDMLKPDELVPLLSSEGIAESLFEFLPEEHRSAHQVVELAHSPQFQQQVQSFSKALQTGQIDLQQFGLGADTGFTAAEFLQAIENKVVSEKNSDGS